MNAGRSFLWAARHRTAQATYPQAQWATSSPAYLVLLRVEIGRFTPSSFDEGIVTVPLILASRRTGVTRYAALWSPDFPLCTSAQRSSGLLHSSHCTERQLEWTQESGTAISMVRPKPSDNRSKPCPKPAPALTADGNRVAADFRPPLP